MSTLVGGIADSMEAHNIRSSRPRTAGGFRKGAGLLGLLLLASGSLPCQAAVVGSKSRAQCGDKSSTGSPPSQESLSTQPSTNISNSSNGSNSNSLASDSSSEEPQQPGAQDENVAELTAPQEAEQAEGDSEDRFNRRLIDCPDDIKDGWNLKPEDVGAKCWRSSTFKELYLKHMTQKAVGLGEITYADALKIIMKFDENVMIQGGAVRDLISGLQPKDIDLAFTIGGLEDIGVADKKGNMIDNEDGLKELNVEKIMETDSKIKTMIEELAKKSGRASADIASNWRFNGEQWIVPCAEVVYKRWNIDDRVAKNKRAKHFIFGAIGKPTEPGTHGLEGKTFSFLQPTENDVNALYYHIESDTIVDVFGTGLENLLNRKFEITRRIPNLFRMEPETKKPYFQSATISPETVPPTSDGYYQIMQAPLPYSIREEHQISFGLKENKMGQVRVLKMINKGYTFKKLDEFKTWKKLFCDRLDQDVEKNGVSTQVESLKLSPDLQKKVLQNLCNLSEMDSDFWGES